VDTDISEVHIPVWGELPSFTLHWQKRRWEGDKIWWQECIYSEFCVIIQWFFLISCAYKCFILVNWEQHCHLFPLLLIYIYLLVTDGSGVHLKLTFNMATFCGTGSWTMFCKHWCSLCWTEVLVLELNNGILLLVNRKKKT